MKANKTTEYPLIYYYLKKYQENPNSRVFAPLSEAYRKAGLLDEALEVARDGVRLHPYFMGGRVALARILFDKLMYAEVVEELTQVVEDIPDNLVAQRLLAESCLVLGKTAEALSAYKMLLYFSPQDSDTARIVQELEAQAYEKGALVLNSDLNSSAYTDFNILPAPAAISDDPARKKSEKIKKIEKLQRLLQQIERRRILA